MKEIGFLVKGQTFLRAVGTLIYFSNKVGIKPLIVAYKERAGKQYDNIDNELLKKITKHLDCSIKIAKNDNHALSLLSDCNAVVAQDIHWHYPFIVGEKKTFSISLFFDTMHYAIDNKGKKHSIPTKTYFADTWFKEKTFQILGEEWPALVCGSPTFDHSLFVEKTNYEKGSVLFLTPPQQSLDQHEITQINELIDFCAENKVQFILKDRVKTPWNASSNSKILRVNSESGFPYSSMELMMNTHIHITAYGTSIFESNFLGKPAINLPVKISGGGGRNHTVKSYGADMFYDNGLSMNYTGNLIEDYQKSILKEQTKQRRKISMEDNYSIDILKDIVSNI